MTLNLDDNQQFILDQMKFGLANKPTPEPITDIDLERLGWSAESYNQIPENEWNDWSRKTHWALQYAFSHDTSRLQDKEKLAEWRKRCIAVVNAALKKGNTFQTVLESATLHFVQHDLLHSLIDVYGFNGLTDDEQNMAQVFSISSQQNTREAASMSNTLVNISGMIDRLLFSLGIFLTIIFTVLRLFGKIDWEWKWILSPLWIYLILTFLRVNLIVKPSLKNRGGRDK